MAITFQKNTTRSVSVVRGKCVSMLIFWQYDHTGRGENWRLTATNISRQFRTIEDAKQAARATLTS